MSITLLSARRPQAVIWANRADDSTPWFAEMAPPGACFEGNWQERDFVNHPEIRRLVRWPEGFGRARVLDAANDYAARLLAAHRQYADWTGLETLAGELERLESRLAGARESGACLLCLGWGGGMLSKSAHLDTSSAEYRQILQNVPIYARAAASNLPFPKTRRIVFLNNRPATLPGWALLEIE